MCTAVVILNTGIKSTTKYLQANVHFPSFHKSLSFYLIFPYVFQKNKHKANRHHYDGTSIQEADPPSTSSTRDGGRSIKSNPSRKSNWDVIEHYNKGAYSF